MAYSSLRLVRVLVVPFVVVLLMSLVAGAQERPQLTLIISDSAEPYTPPVVEVFEELHNVDVEILYLPGGTEERITFLINRYLGGLGMDVVHVTPSIAASLIEAGVVTELTPFLEREPSLGVGDFVPAGIASYALPSGEVYGLPMDIALRSFVANLDLIREAGLAHPNDLGPDAWNWDMLTEYGTKLTKAAPDGQITQYGFRFNESHVPTLVTQAGSYFFNHPTAPTASGVLLPGTELAIETWAGWFHPNPIAHRNGEIHDASGGFTVAMSIQTTSTIIDMLQMNLLFDWDVIRYPRGPVTNAHWDTISAYVLGSNSKHPDLAWELLKYLVTDPDHALGLIGDRSRPPAYIPNLRFYVQENFPAGAPESVSLYREMILNPKMEGDLSFPGWSRFRSELNRILRTEVATGMKPVRTALEELEHLAQSLLTR